MMTFTDFCISQYHRQAAAYRKDLQRLVGECKQYNYAADITWPALRQLVLQCMREVIKVTWDKYEGPETHQQKIDIYYSIPAPNWDAIRREYEIQI